ncbi:hypothetical protein F5Y00DRAFT_229133 [Daldinia vernicosa]|uniref:uncharacterized protein n=1 Tax=Daldinia vernicosa TaxID=114800 RepID=UPI002007BC37|nr:uncharacterized protein F5Y00DRAFT_229133 [Daldinia vernicosa]KAI0851726.1 hypothetical protein F5Y00DRAFT_229133 [Daldinia vernicosa]
MQFSTISLSLFVAFAAAQNSTLPDLVSQLPACASSCLNSSSESAGCAATDFTCLCSEDKRQSFISSISGCIGLSAKCSQDDISKLTTLAPEICDAATSNPDPSAVASASNIITSAIGPTSTPDAGVRPEVGMGLVGVAAFAALAL